MITEDIISRFELQVDEASELSDDESLALANEVYLEVSSDRQWEWLKTLVNTVTSISVPYIALPTNFKELSKDENNESIIYVGTEMSEYKTIQYSTRNKYINSDGYCYIDIPNKRLVFTKQPTSVKTVQYDYIKIPDDLTISTSPLVTTTQFGNMIAYGMSAHFPSIEQADKNSSYMNENKVEYFKILSNLALEDANIKLSY